MECNECVALETSFLDARRQWLQRLGQGDLTPEDADQLSRAELHALLAFLEHRIQHDIDSRPANLPASRNMGGIIAPY